jgi:hypothetical protein
VAPSNLVGAEPMGENHSNEAFVLSLLEGYGADEAEAMEVEPAPHAEDWRAKYLSWIDQGELPPEWSEARCIARMAKSFTTVDGEVYKRASFGVLQQCIPIPHGHELLRDIHASVCGHHMAPRTLVGNAFHQGFYWPTVVADANEVVHTCEGCQFYARKTNLPAHVLQTIPVTWPFAVWGLDIVGPLRKVPGGYTHLLVAVDKFPKWIETRPITNLRAEQAVSFFTDIIHRFGVPNSIIKWLPIYWQEIPRVLRQIPNLRGLGSRHASTDQWSGGACQWHDPTRPKAQDFRCAEQVWTKMAPGVAIGRSEPQDHPEQSHRIHPILPSLWHGGRSPHGLGIRVA